jgi:DNA transformation protein
LFAPLGGVTFKRMFSSYGIMREGMMFALISRDLLYFRTDAAAAARHAAEGAPQWQPHMRGKTMAMPYWQVPERLLDEPEEFAQWAREAFAIAARNKAAKAPKGRKSAAGRKPVAAKSTKTKRKAAPKRR